MVVLRTRGQIIAPTETVQLRVQFYNFSGVSTDLPLYPTITLVQPSGNVALGPTRVGVYREGTGLYGYDYAVGMNPAVGVYTDVWHGITSDGYTITQQLNFVVYPSQMPMMNTDGYVALGDDPGFDYSQTAIININKLLKTLRARLKSSGKSKSTDAYGNVIYVDCDIFSVDQLVTFLGASLSEFNQIGHQTFFQFDHTNIIDQFHAILVQGAVLMALSSQALIERGREYSVTDSGISFQMPTISELLTTQWNAEMSNHWEKVRHVKEQLKPSPTGLGTLTSTNGGVRNSVLARLRHAGRFIY